jgi:hypothetical protein
MRRYAAAAVAVLVLLVAASALSNSYNTPTIDGRVTTDPGDWQSDELAGRDPRDDCRHYPDQGDLRDLWVTWDETNLYFGVRTVNSPANNGYVLYIDEDAQEGITGATDFRSAAFYPRHVTFSTMGVDAIFGVWNLQPLTEGIRHCDDLSVMSPVEGAYAEINPGIKHYEGVIPWDGLYGLGEGVVPEGTILRFVAAVVGGDNTGAFDALPTTTSGMESDPSTPDGAYTDLDLFIEIPVDIDEDGVPDTNYPPGGSISGTVALGDTTDHETVVTVTAYQGGEAIWNDRTPAGGGEYEIERLADGIYDVKTNAFSYLPVTIEGVAVADTSETAGIDFLLEKVTGRIEGEVAITGGPDVDVTVGVYDATTGVMGGDGEVVVEGGTGAFSIGTVLDGTWLVLAEGKGYVEDDTMATITDGDTTNVGLLTLPVVVATKYGFSDSLGNSIYGAGTTVSLPDSGIYYYARAWVEPRDDGDRVAYWDYDAQGGIVLSATKLDPAYATSDTVLFAGPDEELLADATLTSEMFEDGRAPFLTAGYAVEVVRVFATNAAIRDTLQGVLEVGIAPPAPVRLALSADATTIAAGDGVARITGQLVDASGNDAEVSDVIANMTAGGVGGDFSRSSPETESNGRFEIDFSGAVAGTTFVSAFIDPASPYTNLAVDTLTVVLTPGEAVFIEMKTAPRALRPGDSATVTAQVVDAWGNDVALDNLSIALSASPAALLASIDSPIVTGATGQATGQIVAGDDYGIVEVSGAAGGIEIETLHVPIDATIRAMDEVAPESDADHNSDPGVDLTALYLTNSDDALNVGLLFSSVWGGAHLGIAIESNGDAAGATVEPFRFPITYDYAMLPDYAFTYKYYDGSYADFRRWDVVGVVWQFYDWDDDSWHNEDDWTEGVRAEDEIAHGESDVWFRVPFSVIGVALGDTVRVQAYVMQEVPGDPDPVKYTALDSTPHDATHDMLPDVGDWWETASNQVTLSNYQSYVLREGGLAPELTDGDADPSPAQLGDLVTYTVRVTDTGGGIGDVFLDLSDIGGDRFVRMADDGTRADEYARDGIYTAEDELTASASDGEHTVTVTAGDATNEASATLGIVIDVDNPAMAIRQFDDPEGDDHGPNGGTDHPGEQIDGLYYKYPTNLVFRPGSFDITGVEIFADGDRIVFRTHIRDLVYHQDPSAADWGAPQPSQQTCDNPNRTDLNLQKLDIYIDAEEAKGATSGFPNRYVDIATVDAWDYGISAEGWGKWFVVSNSSNSTASWDLHKNDSDISMCNDHIENYIDVSVDRALLELPSDPTQNDAILSWDIIVCLSSHDGESNDQNLGGIRWVNATTSEWQISGGRDGEGGRDRDPNIMDVAVSPGQGREPGRTQEEMLDYTTAEAEQRFDNRQVACVLEASFAIDTAPPVIYDFARDPELQHIPWVALNGAPAVVWTTITDVTGIETARLRWQPVGLPAFRDSVDMVNLAGDIWAADIPREDVIANTNVITLNKVGDGRILEARIYAVDSSDSANAIASSPVTFGVLEPWSDSQTLSMPDTLHQSEDRLLVFQDGTVLTVEGGDLPGAGGEIEFTVTPVPESLVDVSSIRDDMEFVGVARDLTAQYAEGTAVSLVGTPSLTLHYPQYEAGGLDEEDFGLFGWIPETERWILKGGAGNPAGNTVTGEIPDVGTYGVFYWEALDVGGSDGLSGVIVEPNPFSPNGDGLYDEAIVTFFLGREADYVNVEFYDLAGRLARRLVFQGPTDYTGRNPNTVTWDGTDKQGQVVPYGIYVMRVEARFKTEPTFERVNRSVVVIK